MKIGIVTPFDSRNFGNRLQNYALQQVLRQYADEVVTIKNKPALENPLDRLRRSTPLAESVGLNSLLGEKRKAAMLRFNREYLNISRNRYWYNREYAALKKEDICDWYCAGSDQIWNPALSREGGFNYLMFAPAERTFSYAASFGVAEIPEEKQDAVRAGLRHIRNLSLREDAGRNIVKDLTGSTDVPVLPDPTLLLPRGEWDKVRKPTAKPLPQAYLLTCFLGTLSPRRRSAIAEAAKQQAWEVVDLMDPASPYYAVGPGEFLHLIANAALVCTDSFHASVFSFLYQRPLAIFDREGEGHNMGSRLDTLVKTYRLEACRAKEDRLPAIPQKADYSPGYAQLQRERLRAKAFLDSVFSAEERP